MIPLTSCDAKSWEKAKVEVITETVGAECIFIWVIVTDVNSLRDFFISCFNVQGHSQKKIYVLGNVGI